MPPAITHWWPIVPDALENVYVPAVDADAGSRINGALTLLVVFAPVVMLAIEIEPPLVRSKEFPLALPMLYAGSADPEKVMFLMFRPTALIVIPSVVLAPVKVAVSPLFNDDVEPGKVPAPVLQFISEADATQFEFVGVALHVALALWAGSLKRKNPEVRRIIARKYRRLRSGKKKFMESGVQLRRECDLGKTPARFFVIL